jgi:hypothetical protein
MAEDSKGTKGGIGFVGLLQLLFIAFKLLKVIDWSWLWVLGPTWITVGLAILIAIVVVIFSNGDKT